MTTVIRESLALLVFQGRCLRRADGGWICHNCDPFIAFTQNKMLLRHLERSHKFYVPSILSKGWVCHACKNPVVFQSKVTLQRHHSNYHKSTEMLERHQHPGCVCPNCEGPVVFGRKKILMHDDATYLEFEEDEDKDDSEECPCSEEVVITEQDWLARVGALPFGPRFAFTFDATMKPRRKDIVHAYHVAMLDQNPLDSQTLNLSSLLETPVAMKLDRPRLFLHRTADEDEEEWQEILGGDDITHDMELRLSYTTPTKSLVLFEGENLHILIACIHEYLMSKPGVWRVLLFGFFLRHPTTAREIDVGFESTEVQDPSKVVEWAEELEALVGKKVDIVDLSSSFKDDMRAARSDGMYISPAGTLFEDRTYVEHIDFLGKCLYAMQMLRDELLFGLEFPQCSEAGIAKRLDRFYLVWQNFALRYLKIHSLPIPSSHVKLVKLFSVPGSQVIPLMNERAALIIDDLQKFEVCGMDWDMKSMTAKVGALMPVIDWAKAVALSYTV